MKKRPVEHIFQKRFDRHQEELHQLYTSLYGNDAMFEELCSRMRQFFETRNKELKALDARREIWKVSRRHVIKRV